MSLLNISNDNLSQIQFGSSLIFELRQDTNGIFYTNLMIRNNTNSQPTVLKPVKLKQCDQLCNMENFLDLVSNKTVENFTSACQIEFSIQTTTNTMTTVNQVECNEFLNSTQVLNTTKKNSLSQLELALIITTSILGAVCLALLVFIALLIYRNKTTKTVF